jgi:hypothetical protein
MCVASCISIIISSVNVFNGRRCQLEAAPTHPKLWLPSDDERQCKSRFIYFCKQNVSGCATLNVLSLVLAKILESFFL